MSVFDVPKACQNGTSTSPISRVSLQLFRSEIATCSKMYQFVFTQMLKLQTGHQVYNIKFDSDLRQVSGFLSPGLPVSCTNLTDRHDITFTII
jgi:hypothetical protein